MNTFLDFTIYGKPGRVLISEICSIEPTNLTGSIITLRNRPPFQVAEPSSELIKLWGLPEEEDLLLPD